MTEKPTEQDVRDDGGVDQFDNWMDMFVATADRFKEENEDLEAILAGDVGLHAYFVADGDDPTRGVHTAILQAVYEATEEIHVDADLVKHNQGEVIPETVRLETMNQLEQFTYIPGDLREKIGEKVEDRVRKNMEGSA